MGRPGQQGCRGGHTSPVCPVTALRRPDDAPPCPLSEESHNFLACFLKVFSDHRLRQGVRSGLGFWGKLLAGRETPSLSCPSLGSCGRTVGRKLSRGPCADGRRHTLVSWILPLPSPGNHPACCQQGPPQHSLNCPSLGPHRAPCLGVPTFPCWVQAECHLSPPLCSTPCRGPAPSPCPHSSLPYPSIWIGFPFTP